MKMPDKIEAWMLGCCGVLCLCCTAFLKNSCSGCQNINEAAKRRSCQNCRKKACAYAQGLHYCYECTKFPCHLLKDLDRRYRIKYGLSPIDDGKQAQIDLMKMLEEKRVKYSCSCQGIIDQYTSCCSECQKGK